MLGCACCADSSTELIIVDAQTADNPPGAASSSLDVDEDSRPAPPATPAYEEPEAAEPPAVVDSLRDMDAAEADKPILTPDFLDFDATIDKSGGEKLGLDISAYDGKTLLVGRIKTGPVERWNAAQEAGAPRIDRGDRLISVNGVSGDSDELLAAAKADILNLKVRRIMEYTMALDCPSGNEPLGLEFADSVAGDGCVVSAVSGGVAARTNQRNPADVEIRVGDIVLQVNGEATTSAESARLSSAAFGPLEVRLRRPVKD